MQAASVSLISLAFPLRVMNLKTRVAPRPVPGRELVEAAGQLIRIFRYGLDYSFTCAMCKNT